MQKHKTKYFPVFWQEARGMLLFTTIMFQGEANLPEHRLSKLKYLQDTETSSVKSKTV